MDPASGVLAALSLILPLAQSVRKASKFFKEIRNAPDEVERLVESLDQLDQILTGITGFGQRQPALRCPTSAWDLVRSALGICQSRTTRLENLIQRLQVSFQRQRHVQKFWTSMKIAVKNDEIKNLRSDIHDSITSLNTALLINLSYM